MKFKIACGFLAFAMYIAYFGPLMVKLKEFPLGVVLLGGIVLVAIDMWESFRA